MVSRYCSEAAEPEGRLQGVGQLECIMELQLKGCKRQTCLHLAIGEIIFDIPLSQIQEKAQLKSVARGLQISPRRSRQREVAEHIFISVVASRKPKGIQDESVDVDGTIEPPEDSPGTPQLLESSKLDDARKTVVKGMEFRPQGLGGNNDLTFHVKC
ncbi:hypothetical protein Tco_0689608 [Tanacetum coccineum]